MTHHPKRIRLLFAASLACLASLAAIPAWAADDIREQRVQFHRGASSAIVDGRIKSCETVDHIVGARQGQSANIGLATRHTATYFNIQVHGQREVAFFNGSVGENQFEGVLPDSGDYRFRVYMMRSAARRNEVADHRLEIAVAAAPSVDAKVPGTGFNATGNVPRSMSGGQPAGSCPFGVKRQGGGTAMVTVTKPDGRQRVIFFDNGRATGYDQSQADTSAFRATRESDLTTVHIGNDRYEISDAVVSGG